MTPTDPPASSAHADEQDRGSWRDNRYMDGKYDRGWDMSVEMIAAILLWGGVGWLVDRWLGTAPWAMVAGFLVGNAAGIYLVYVRAKADEHRRAQRDQAAQGRPTEGGQRGTGGTGGG